MTGKRAAILKHFIKYGDLTSWECIERYQYTRLAALVHDFKQMGYEFITVSEHNHETHWARYIMTPESRKHGRTIFSSEV